MHASERMWQMEVFRHIGAGRVSELFGKSQLDTDRFIRTLGWRRAAERDLAALDATTVLALSATRPASTPGWRRPAASAAWPSS